MLRFAAICATLLFVASGSSAVAKEPTTIRIGDLSPHDRLEIRTTRYLLRLDIVDPSSGEALASLSRNGTEFSRADRVFVLGATRGRHPEGLMVVRMGQIEVGVGIELAIQTMDAENRRITAAVESFQVTRGVGTAVSSL